ncbi:MAG: hypothetical protein C0483_10330 [Pirellula sp.]|nr:hypothetical protein [Pirellula sp.]
MRARQSRAYDRPGGSRRVCAGVLRISCAKHRCDPLPQYADFVEGVRHRVDVGFEQLPCVYRIIRNTIPVETPRGFRDPLGELMSHRRLVFRAIADDAEQTKCFNH